jgi:hypothetical protein
MTIAFIPDSFMSRTASAAHGYIVSSSTFVTYPVSSFIVPSRSMNTAGSDIFFLCSKIFLSPARPEDIKQNEPPYRKRRIKKSRIAPAPSTYGSSAP